MKKTLHGRTLYIPRMSDEGAQTMAAAFHAIGFDAEPVPKSDAETIELGKKYTSGDECYPQAVTMGGFVQIARQPGFDPNRTAFLMPLAQGPCRFGQYAHYVTRVFEKLGYPDVMVMSPRGEDGYDQFGEEGKGFARIAWRALVAADILRKLLLKTRPYELQKGETDHVFQECLNDVCDAIGKPGLPSKDHMGVIRQAMIRTRERFRKIPARYTNDRPLIGVVGEIYCRLDTFANEDIIRVIESQGGEAWIADIAEWVWQTNFRQQENLREAGERFSKKMLVSKIKNHIQHKDEHELVSLFKEDFRGLEEPGSCEEILERSRPYLPHTGAFGEMVLSTGKAIYMYEKGADGVLDISPFTCMNGIVCEAIYPKVSREHDDIPIKVFYFDGTKSDWERDTGIFIELARGYQKKKKRPRVGPRPLSPSTRLRALATV